MKRYVILRTHGGLGNQIFQILYGRLYAKKYGLCLREVHDIRYPHAFPRSAAIERCDGPSMIQSSFSLLRLPKVIQRLFKCSELPVRLLNSVYLDGYYQKKENYVGFEKLEVKRELARLATELGIEGATIDSILIHLRVGDFFEDKTAAKKHVLERIDGMPDGAYIMTNDEQLLEEPEVSRAMAMRNAILVSTKDQAAEDVLRTMSKFRTINANDSTLTFWASVFSGSDVQLKSEQLKLCQSYFID